MPTEEPVSPRSRWFAIIRRVIAVAANTAVVAAVIFAVVQISQANRFERRRVAIEATAPTRSPEFLAAYSKLQVAYDDDPTMSYTPLLWDDLVYVMSIYDNIAILCLAELADRDLIEQGPLDAMKALVPILDVMKWPPDYRENFDALLSEFQEPS